MGLELSGRFCIRGAGNFILRTKKRPELLLPTAFNIGTVIMVCQSGRFQFAIKKAGGAVVQRRAILISITN